MLECQLFQTDEDAVQRLFQHPHAALATSDAGAHLSFLCDAGFGLHLFGYWVRQRGDLTLEDAVRRVTSLPADIYRLRDRGRVVPGAWADLVLFDEATVGRGEKRRVFDLPGGGGRIDTAARGLHGVWVNGRQVVDENGPIQGARGTGQLLRSFRE